jgi:hypothetical protein
MSALWWAKKDVIKFASGREFDLHPVHTFVCMNLSILGLEIFTYHNVCKYLQEHIWIYPLFEIHTSAYFGVSVSLTSAYFGVSVSLTRVYFGLTFE